MGAVCVINLNPILVSNFDCNTFHRGSVLSKTKYFSDKGMQSI